MKILYSCKIYAKSNKTTLLEHIEDCQKIADFLINDQKKILQKYCQKINIDFEKFKDNLSIAIHYHDFGKATLKWQERLKQKSPKLPMHAPLAGYFIWQEMKKNIPSLLASSSHHSLLTDNSWINLNYGDFNFLKDELTNLNKIKGRKQDINFDILPTYFQNFCIRLRNIEKGINKEWNEKFKSQYSIYLFFIGLADSIASGFEEKKDKDIHDTIERLIPRIQILEEKIKRLDENKKLTATQEKVIKKYTNNDELESFILEAPCGEGKTLASLLFVRELINNNRINRVIFTLPTQTTTNNMVKEFTEEYHIPKEWIGVYHSEIFQFLQSNKDIEEGEIKSKIFQDSFYVRPFNISTIDHLLLSLVNGYKYAPRAFGALQTSLVIIDEMHYYSPHTIGMILCLLKILKKLKLPYFIMSATIPKIIKDKILKINNNVHYFNSDGKDEDKDIDKSPYKIKYINETILDEEEKLNNKLLELIKSNRNKNIGIVVNTIKKAKTLYNCLSDNFKNYQVFMYHSQFTRLHRPIKEKILNIWMKHNKGKELFNDEKQILKEYGFDYKKPLLLIATQVIEISLNLSFDILIS